MNLWLRLFAYLALGATGEGDGGGTDDGAAAEAASAESGDETLDDLIDLAEAGGDQGAGEVDPKDNAAVKDAQKRATTAENQLVAERAARQAAEARAQPAQRYVDPDIEREDAEIAQARAAGQTPEQLNWLQWKIDSNRRIRESQRASYGALAQAQDVQDRTAFERLEITKPAFFKRYAERVESAMAEMRARGQNAPRLAVLRLLIGDDIMNGKIKPKKAAEGATVDRGRSPGVRSDVSAKGKLTEHQKRAARLADRLI